MRPDLDTVPDQDTDTKLTAPLGGAVKLILILAAGLLAIVRVIRVGARMSADLAGTV
jgi:hypothetical protein